MYLCDNDHDEITHNSEHGYREACPLCEAKDQIKELEHERDDLKDEVTDLRAGL